MLAFQHASQITLCLEWRAHERLRALRRWVPPGAQGARSAILATTTVRRRLVVLVLSVLLPMATISLIAACTLYTEQRQAVLKAGLETAKALSLVADRELAHRIGAR